MGKIISIINYYLKMDINMFMKYHIQGKKYALKNWILYQIQFKNIIHEVRISKQISNCPYIGRILDASETKTEVDILM